MNLQNRIALMVRLGKYLQENNEDWMVAKNLAKQRNPWFTSAFIEQATAAIADAYLQEERLVEWIKHYPTADLKGEKKLGIVMAGNIPMVGFHDFLCGFICGHQLQIKCSSKDDVLLPFIIQQMVLWEPAIIDKINVADQLKGCDAYIATGGNQSAQHFEQYFAKYPNIIRRNRTSVAILTGTESKETLQLLSDDIHSYFGLGCRNVTKIYVPEGYDFVPLLQSFEHYKYFRDHHKYSNNYDYQLSILLINNIPYMTNESTILVEQKGLFSPISVLHYEYYSPDTNPAIELEKNESIQAIVGENHLPFGSAQQPNLYQYADGVDTMQFLLSI